MGCHVEDGRDLFNLVMDVGGWMASLNREENKDLGINGMYFLKCKAVICNMDYI